MKKNNLVIKIALGLIVFGLLLTLIGILMGGKFTIFKDGNIYTAYDSNNRIAESSSLEDFNTINIDVDLDNVEIIKSTSNKIELDYNQKVGVIEYEVENDILTITQINSNSIGININDFNNKNTNTLKLYIKEDSILNKIFINQDYGNILIEGLNLQYGEINSSYGNINLHDIASDKITLTMEDGNVTTDNVDVSDTFKLHNKYGSLDLNNSDVSNLIIYLEDGNLDISKVNAYYAELKNKYGNTYGLDFVTNGLLFNGDDGDVDLRGSFFGNTIINNKYGNINMVSDQNEKSYDYSIVNKYGNVDINNEIFNGSILKNNEGTNSLDITCEDGNVKITLDK